MTKAMTKNGRYTVSNKMVYRFIKSYKVTQNTLKIPYVSVSVISVSADGCVNDEWQVLYGANIKLITRPGPTTNQHGAGVMMKES